MRSRIALALITALAVGAMPAFGQDIKVGVILPLSGGVSFDGITDLNGAKLAAEEINAAGGVLGRKIILLPEDGACNPTQSVAAAEKLITREKVVAIIGALCSSATGAVAETVRKYKLPQITGVSTAERLTEANNPWFFRATTTTTLNGQSLGPALLQGGSGKKVAFLVTSDDWGRSAAQAYGNAFKALGATIVATEYFDRNDTDFTERLTKIRAARPDMMFSVGGFQNAANITVQARQVGLTVPIVGEGAFAADAWAKLVGIHTSNVTGILEWVLGIDDEVNRSFVAAYQKSFNDLPTKFSAAGYNTVQILAAALKRAGSAEPEPLREALAQTDYTGLMGNYRFDGKGQAYNFKIFLAEWKDGASVVRQSVTIAKP